MWLIEFIEGELKDVTLPIDSTLTLTGQCESLDSDAISLPEYLSTDVTLNILIDKGHAYLKGWKKNAIKLVRNRIYSVHTLKFFIYKDGNRNPKLKQLYIRRYGFIGALFIALSVFILISILFFIQLKQDDKVSDYLNMIDNGYIKNGKLYLFDNKIKEVLPKNWGVKTLVIEKNKHTKINTLNIDVISKSNSTIPHKIVEKGDYTQVIVDYPEKELKIMRVFGKNGITFEHKENFWIVNDVIKASNLLKSISFDSELPKLKLNTQGSQIIDEKNLPYSIFFSAQGESYIYDLQAHYWVGSLVPGFGIIKSISEENVIFNKDNKIFIYVIPK